MFFSARPAPFDLPRRETIFGLIAVSLAGCSGGPSSLEAPSVNAGSAAAEAMELYDKDGDGFIAGAELETAPGINAAMSTIDADGDGKAAEDEIAARISSWGTSGAGLTTCSARVTLDGKPLGGATVTFEPEPFLGTNFKTATGETNFNGDVFVSIPKEQRVPADAPPGLYIGLYRVKVSKQEGGKETVPAKYNTETTLGQQIAPDDPAVASQKIHFDLKK